MVDPIKSSAEIDLHNPGLLPTLQCTLQCMWHTQKCITGTQTFLISKLGGWKHTTVFHKSSETNCHQMLKHLWQYWCYGNWSVIGNREGRWTFWNLGDIGLLLWENELLFQFIKWFTDLLGLWYARNFWWDWTAKNYLHGTKSVINNGHNAQ